MGPADPSTIAIVGCGFVGSAVARRLPGPVLALSRRPPREPIGVAIHRSIDLLAAPSEAIARALAPARRILVSIAPGPDQDRRRLYVDGVARLLEALEPMELDRVVHCSSTSAIAEHDGWVDESFAEPPTHERGRIQRETEGLIVAFCRRRSIPWVVLRLGGLYGPGREIGARAAVLEGDGGEATNLIHRDDAAAACVAALRLPHETSALVHVCNDDHRTRRELYAELAARRGEPAPRWAAEPAPGPRGKRIRNDRLRTVLGISLLHPRHLPDRA